MQIQALTSNTIPKFVLICLWNLFWLLSVYLYCAVFNLLFPAQAHSGEESGLNNEGDPCLQDTSFTCYRLCKIYIDYMAGKCSQRKECIMFKWNASLESWGLSLPVPQRSYVLLGKFLHQPFHRWSLIPNYLGDWLETLGSDLKMCWTLTGATEVSGKLGFKYIKYCICYVLWKIRSYVPQVAHSILWGPY